MTAALRFGTLSSLIFRLNEMVPFQPRVSTSNATYKEAKFSRMMAKLIARDGKKRKKHWHSPVVLRNTSSEEGNTKRNSPVEMSRRSQQVGTVLYRYISDIVTSGELHPDLSVDIVKVTVMNDFSAVNVSWVASGQTENDNDVQHLLNKNAGKLRSILMSLHLLSQIPRIHFVKDSSEANARRVDELLQVADFGDDYTQQESLLYRLTEARPLKTGRAALSEFYNNGSTHRVADAEIDRSDVANDSRGGDIANEKTVTHEETGSLRLKSDVYGLDRDKLLDKVIVSMKQSHDRSFGRCEVVPKVVQKVVPKVVKSRKTSFSTRRNNKNFTEDTVLHGHLEKLDVIDEHDGNVDESFDDEVDYEE